MNLTYSTGSSTITRSFRIGGIPLDNSIIPVTSIYSGSSIHTVSFIPTFIEQIDKKVVIELRKGPNNFHGPFILVTDNIQLEKGIYTVLASSVGFKSDKREIFVDHDMVVNLIFVPDKLNADETYIVFNWEGKSVIDAKTSFILNTDVYCEVSYVNKVCGGVKLTNSKSSDTGGFSVFRIKPIGAYQYLFYAILDEPKVFNAEVKVYVKDSLEPVFNLNFGNRFQENSEKKLDVWGGFCIDGAAGISSVRQVNAYSSRIGLGTLRQVCEEFYGPVNVFPPDLVKAVQVVKKNDQ